MSTRINARRVAVFSGHTGSIYGLAVDPFTGNIYSGGGEGYLICWNKERPNEGQLMAKAGNPIYSLMFDGVNIWVGTSIGAIYLINAVTKTEVKSFSLGTSGIYAMVQNDGKVYCCDGEGFLTIINHEFLTIKNRVKISEKSLRCLAFHPAATEGIIGASDGNLYRIDREGEFLGKIEGAHGNSIFSLAFSLEGKKLFTGGRDAHINMWDAFENYLLIQSVPAHNLHVQALLPNEKNNILISSSMDKTIKFWDLNSLELLRVMDFQRHGAHVNSINRLALLTNDEFVSVSDDKKLMIWGIDS